MPDSASPLGEPRSERYPYVIEHIAYQVRQAIGRMAGSHAPSDFDVQTEIRVQELDTVVPWLRENGTAALRALLDSLALGFKTPEKIKYTEFLKDWDFVLEIEEEEKEIAVYARVLVAPGGGRLRPKETSG